MVGKPTGVRQASVIVRLDGTAERNSHPVICMPSRLYVLLQKLVGRTSRSAFPVVQKQIIRPIRVTHGIEWYAHDIGLDDFPNDLTRMLYLASLRDCNSGLYLHPQLSQRIGVEESNQVLTACHNEVFGRLLTVPLSGYVLQMEEYIRYARTDRSTMLKTWQSLQAYRSTIPVAASSLSSELFCLNIELALTILRDAPTFVDRCPDYTPS